MLSNLVEFTETRVDMETSKSFNFGIYLNPSSVQKLEPAGSDHTRVYLAGKDSSVLVSGSVGQTWETLINAR